MMTWAKYGRMRHNTFVKKDYGHIGCHADVLDMADTICSGRHQCQLEVPVILFAQMKPCPEDLKSYLEAEYQCVKGKVECNT